MEQIKEELEKLQDIEYRDFQKKLILTTNKKIIGVRTKELRNLAKKMIKDNTYQSFLKELPHEYFEEDQLHGFILSEIKDYEECLKKLNEFLPYINNWATCDQTSPKIFKKNRDKLILEIKKWIKSNETYTIRFGIKMMMEHYLEDEFKEEYLTMISKIKSEEYYVNMMIAWFFATSLHKQYQKTIPYIEKNKLNYWTHNKTIQKAIESYRITKEQKEYLKSLKIGKEK